MILLEDKLIADEILEAYFTCDLSKCHGACCVKGDAGAPLVQEEITVIQKNLEKIKPYINQEGKDYIANNGFFTERSGELETECIPTGECVFLKYEGKTALCGIEQANNAEKFDFQKPLSCHLYPIRVSKVGEYTALNYDKWDICNAACAFGRQTKLKLYKFLQSALTRAFGEEFYQQLAAYDDYNQDKEKIN